MASKTSRGSGEASIYDPGASLGRASAIGDGGSELDTLLQAHLVLRQNQLVIPSAGSSSPSIIGTSQTAIGTGTAISPTRDTFSSYRARVDYLSGTSAPNLTAGVRMTPGPALISATPGENAGFMAIMRWGPSATTNTQTNPATNSLPKLFVGLAGNASIGDVDPATVQSAIGFIMRNNNTTIRLVSTDQFGNVVEEIDTGVPRYTFQGITGDNDVYECRFFSPFPRSGQQDNGMVYCRIARLNPDRPFARDFVLDQFGPLANYSLLPQIWMASGLNGTNVRASFYGMFMERLSASYKDQGQMF